MNLKNYTTEVPAVTSINRIENLLVDFGATNINKSYENGRCIAISFIIDIDGNKIPFRLPAKVRNIFIWLRKQRPNSNEKTHQQQAERIAWKQQHELLHLQLSLIEMQQLEKMEALLPYTLDVKEDKTFFEKLKEQKYKALLP